MLMEKTQFSFQVWNLLSEQLKESIVQMTDKEVAWEKDDALAVVEVFEKTQIAINGIELFYYQSENESLQTTSDIFSSSKIEPETWQEFVIRSCESAKHFVDETFANKKVLYKGKSVYNIWAFTEEEYLDS
jgi:hypothetical protein